MPEDITKTYLYNFDPLKPHFYIVKMGFSGAYIISLIFTKNTDCGYLLEPPRWGGSNEYPQSMFWAEIWKISEFLSEQFLVFWGEIFYIFKYAYFHNDKFLHGAAHIYWSGSVKQRYSITAHVRIFIEDSVLTWILCKPVKTYSERLNCAEWENMTRMIHVGSQGPD